MRQTLIEFCACSAVLIASVVFASVGPPPTGKSCFPAYAGGMPNWAVATERRSGRGKWRAMVELERRLWSMGSVSVRFLTEVNATRLGHGWVDTYSCACVVIDGVLNQVTTTFHRGSMQFYWDC